MPRSSLYPIKRNSKPGAAPGTMVASLDAPHPTVSVITYGSDTIVERQDVTVDEITVLRNAERVTWVDVTGLGSAELISQLGSVFDLHKLALEDVLNTHQRPKVEEFDDHVFFVSRMCKSQAPGETEQLSIFLGEDFVLSFQEDVGDCLEPIRERLRRGKGRVRDKGADYLCYALLDAVIDDYFPVLERYGEALEALEDDVVSRSEPSQVSALHSLTRELLTIRRAVWPHREMINVVIRDQNQLISKDAQLYLRDVYDHTVQLMDIIETIVKSPLGWLTSTFQVSAPNSMRS